MPESINSKIREQYDHDDSGGSLDTNQGDFLDSQGASGTSNNTKWRNWAEGTGTSLNTRLFHKHGGSGSFNTRWKNWIAFGSTHSFNFDGSNDYLVTEKISLDFTNISISMWAKFDSFSSDDIFFAIADADSNDEELILYNQASNSNKFSAYFPQGSSENNSSYSIPTGEWVHLALTKSGTALKLYANGNEVKSVSYTNTNTYSRNIIIGARKTSSYVSHADALIDEVAIWDTALSASDVTSIYNNGKIVDLSKSASYGTDRTANLKLWLRCGDKVLPESDASIARSDFYTDFDGSNDSVIVEQTFTTDNFAISFWINPDNVTGDKYLFDQNAGLCRSVIIGYQDGHINFINDDNDAGSYHPTGTASDTQIPVSIGEWQHYVMMTDGTKVYGYRNGVEIINVTGKWGASGAEKLWIGQYEGGSSTYYEGKMSNVGIYQTVLDAQTIKQFAKSRYTPMRDNRFSVVDFDGSDDRIIAGNLFSGGGSTATFSTWVFADDSGGSIDRIVGQTNSSSNMPDPFEVQWNHTDNTIRAFFADGTASHYKFINSNATTANKWHHIVVTFDMSTATIKIYIDGVDETGSGSSLGSPPTSIASTSSPLKMGESAGGDRFKGSMLSVAIYDTVKDAYALYQKGITYNESSETSLIAYYRMGDDTSKVFPTIADSSSNSNDGTMTNMASDDIVQQMVAGYDMGAFESTEELSAERIINGDFSAWTADNPDGWSVSTDLSGGVESDDVKVTEDANGARIISDGTNINLRQSSAMIVGTMYKVIIVVHSATSGNIKTDGLTSNITNINASGTYTVTTTASSTTLNIKRNTACDIVVSRISVKEVLQSADLSDTHPVLIDVTQPVLGGEEVSEPSFASSSGWSLGTGWSISSNTLSSDGSQSAGSNASASITTGAGYYRVVITVNSISSGTIRPNLESWGSYISTTGTSTQFFTLTGNNNLTIQASADFVGSISFASVKEVFGNVGKMTNQDSADLVYSSVLPDQSFLTGVNSAYNFIDLDGTDACIKNDSFTGHQSNTGTLSGWFNFDDVSTQQRFFGVGGTTGAGATRLIEVDGGNVFFIGYGSANVQDWDSGASVEANNWYHLALTWNGTSAVIYVNGTAYSQTLSGLVTPTGTKIQIGGAVWDGNDKINGKASGVGVWNKTLSSTEISAIYTAGRHTNLLDSYSDNLKAYFAFGALDATSGLADTDSTIYDRSGNSVHGTTSGTATGDLKSPPNAQPEGYSKQETNRSTTTP